MITRYFAIIRRWLWLLVFVTFLSGVTAYWVTSQTPTVYEARTRLIIGPGIDVPNPTLNDLRTGGQLMQTYAELVTTDPVMQAVVDDLGLKTSYHKLNTYIRISQNQEAQILTLIVEHEDPALAMLIANTLAEKLIALSPSDIQSPQADLKYQMSRQAAKLETEIANMEERISELETNLQTINSGEARNRLSNDLADERNRLTEAYKTLAQLYVSLQNALINQVKIVEEATRSVPIESPVQLQIVLGSMAGLILGLFAILTFEYFDDTVKTPGELAESTGLPILGSIAKHQPMSGSGPQRLVVHALPDTQAAENYRMLGTKLLSKYTATRAEHRILAGGGNSSYSQQFQSNYSPRSVLFSAAHNHQDIGEIAANVAVVLAQTGRRVILVDTHLHESTIAKLFGMDQRLGLADILTGRTETLDLTPIDWLPYLSVVPSGLAPSNTFELLASTRMADLIEELESQADIVIIAAAPLLSYADSLVLASRVDEVLIVARSGQTHRATIGDVVKSLTSLNAYVAGAVLDYNQPPHQLALLWRITKSVGAERKSRDKDGILTNPT